MRRPNVLLLLTDQHRWDALGCMGNRLIRTPNLDALAAQGALLTHTFANNPVCMPSRQSMLSGQYPSAIGCMANGVEMPPDVPTLHGVLKPHGYHTASLGKLHFLNHATRDHRQPHPAYGFDTLIVSDEPGCYDDAYVEWVARRSPEQVDNCRCTSPPAVVDGRVEKQPREVTEPYVFEGPEELTHSAFVADQTIEYIRRHRDEPFFAIAGFYSPHAPVNPPRRFVEMYDPADMPLPARAAGENWCGIADDQWRVIKAYYYALVSHVDDQVGRILQELDGLGLADDTLVIFTADHGEHLGDHGLIAKGPPGYDSCTRVPMICRLPGRIAGGTVRQELVELVDFAPTVLDFCGVQQPPFMQGLSFAPLLEGGNYSPRRSAYIEFRIPFGQSVKVVRTREFWYGVDRHGRQMLFDLSSDPDQLHDVASLADYQPALEQMRQELIRRWFTVEKQYPLRTGPY